jgi:hypothetical protein
MPAAILRNNMATETPEEKIARLEVELHKATEQNTGLRTGSETVIKNLQNQLDTVTKDKSALQVAYDNLLKESNDQIGSLSAELDKAKSITDIIDPSITVDKKEYRVIGKKFNWRGTEYTVQDLLKSKSLQQELVGAGAGFLILK